MNILHLSAVKNWGGGEKHLENLCRELAILNPSITNKLICNDKADYYRLSTIEQLEIIPAPLGFKLDPRYILRLIKTCKKHHIDLIHIHDSSALAIAVTANHLAELPPFIFSKKTSFPIRLKRLTLYKYNYYKIKRVLCVSETTKCIASKNVENSNILTCIYHGTSLKDKSGTTPFKLRKHLKLNNETVIVGNIAHHIWPKDLETFINVANELIHVQKKDMHFVQIGAFTAETPSLLNLIKKNKLESHISFLGSMENASNFIPQFDISVMTSKSEGVPQFIYESFYHGVPVISTNVGGIPEVITHRVNGLLAPAGDCRELAKHVLSLANNRQWREEFTVLSYKKLTKNFTSTLMAEKTYSEYKKVLNER
ncbi:glycosyltransferase family 4 protein [Autumnicola musiva]|uniref:Glycosyltransferase family 4 protein n=1 Tax=Autumnicola musiva TaxID=3075589 RepID=A0ABU3D3P7_9FLAO|nr:glycosyltransferase family 4 protein [Zunongwangia sp. F117]MDT0675980.1 glycosyltransferase family 4 protein [Zunongwangia sp. F117]